MICRSSTSIFISNLMEKRSEEKEETSDLRLSHERRRDLNEWMNVEQDEKRVEFLFCWTKIIFVSISINVFFNNEKRKEHLEIKKISFVYDQKRKAKSDEEEKRFSHFLPSPSNPMNVTMKTIFYTWSTSFSFAYFRVNKTFVIKKRKKFLSHWYHVDLLFKLKNLSSYQLN